MLCEYEYYVFYFNKGMRQKLKHVNQASRKAENTLWQSRANKANNNKNKKIPPQFMSVCYLYQ